MRHTVSTKLPFSFRLRREVSRDFRGEKGGEQRLPGCGVPGSFFPVAQLRANTPVHCAEGSSVSLGPSFLLPDQDPGIPTKPLKDTCV